MTRAELLDMLRAKLRRRVDERAAGPDSAEQRPLRDDLVEALRARLRGDR